MHSQAWIDSDVIIIIEIIIKMACVWSSIQVFARALGLIASEIVIDTVWAPNSRGILTRSSLVYN